MSGTWYSSEAPFKSIELPVATIHRRDMTVKLFTVNQSKQTKLSVSLFDCWCNCLNVGTQVMLFPIINYISAAAWLIQQNGMCAQRRLRSAWASVQSDQSLRCPHEETFGFQLPIERTAKILVPSLIWVFAERTCHFVFLIMRRLIFCPLRVLDFDLNFLALGLFAWAWVLFLLRILPCYSCGTIRDIQV